MGLFFFNVGKFCPDLPGFYFWPWRLFMPNLGVITLTLYITLPLFKAPHTGQIRPFPVAINAIMLCPASAPFLPQKKERISFRPSVLRVNHYVINNSLSSNYSSSLRGHICKYTRQSLRDFASDVISKLLRT